MTQMDMLVYAMMIEGILVIMMGVCTVWLLTAQTRKSDGHAVNENHILIPKKIMLICSVIFMISFGLCSAWLFLPQIFK